VPNQETTPVTSDETPSVPHGLVGDEEVLENDLFVQEYFLYCFNLVMQERDSENVFVESDTGMTFYKYTEQEKNSNRLVGIIRGSASDLNLWRIRVREITQSLSINGIDVDYMDVDMLFSTLISNFKKQKRDLHNSLKKEFLRKTGVVTAPLKYSELLNIIKQAEKAELMASGSAIPDPLTGYCGKMS
jgi:hypothetical protein